MAERQPPAIWRAMLALCQGSREPPPNTLFSAGLAGCGKSPDFGKTAMKRLKIGIRAT
jgi:hypothetical protein